MKYKVGDVVKLKSKEELCEINWSKSFAEKYENTEEEILAIDCGDYVINTEGVNIHIGEDAIEKIVIENSEDCIYTLDELKKRVDELKEYATRLSSELNVELSIEVETEIRNEMYKEIKGSSKINIID